MVGSVEGGRLSPPVLSRPSMRLFWQRQDVFDTFPPS